MLWRTIIIRSSKFDYFAITTVVLISAFFCFIGIGDLPYLDNEVLSIGTAYEKFYHFFFNFSPRDFADPDQSILYFYILRLFRFFDDSITSSRLISYICYIFSSVVVYKTLRLYFDKLLSFSVALAFVFNMSVVMYAHYVIYYSFTIFFSSLVFYNYLKINHDFKEKEKLVNLIIIFTSVLSLANISSLYIITPVLVSLYIKRVFSLKQKLFIILFHGFLAISKYIPALIFRVYQRGSVLNTSGYFSGGDINYTFHDILKYQYSYSYNEFYVFLSFVFLAYGLYLIWKKSTYNVLALAYVLSFFAYIIFHYILKINESVSRYYLAALPAIYFLFALFFRNVPRFITVLFSLFIIYTQLVGYTVLSIQPGVLLYYPAAKVIEKTDHTIYSNMEWKQRRFTDNILKFLKSYKDYNYKELSFKQFLQVSKNGDIYILYDFNEAHLNLLNSDKIHVLYKDIGLLILKKEQKESIPSKTYYNINELLVDIDKRSIKEIILDFSRYDVLSDVLCDPFEGVTFYGDGNLVVQREFSTSIKVSCKINKLLKYIRGEDYKHSHAFIESILNYISMRAQGGNSSFRVIYKNRSYSKDEFISAVTNRLDSVKY